MTETLTTDSRGRRQKPRLEYSLDDGVTWKQWDEQEEGFGPYKVLADRIGVYFDGDKPPAELIAAGADAKLRLTGTVAGDDRLAVTVDRDTGIFPGGPGPSPNARDVILFLDVSDRFHLREIWDTGGFRSRLAGPGETADDEDALREFLLDLQDVEQAAAMSVEAVLHGFHYDYEIGDLITGVSIWGRNISFNRNSPGAGEKRYPQVTGIRWLQTDQTTVLDLDFSEAG